MKRFLISLFLILASVSFSNAQSNTYICYTSNGTNCVPSIASYSSKAINISTATTTEIIPAVTGKTIYITAWDVIAGGTGNITLVYGTGTNCGTGTTSLTGAYNLIAQAGISKGIGLGAVFTLPLSNAFCITTSASVQMSGSVSYGQF